MRDLALSTGAALAGVGIGVWLTRNDPTVALGKIEQVIVESTLSIAGLVVDTYTARRFQ